MLSFAIRKKIDNLSSRFFVKLMEMLNAFYFLHVFIFVSDELEVHRRKKASI